MPTTIALNYHNIGDEYYREHRFGEAIAAFDAGIRVCEEQIRRGDRSEMIQLDLAQNLLYRSRAVRDAGHLDEAVAAGKRAVAVFGAVLDRDPGNYSCAIRLHLAHDEVGSAYRVLKRWDDLIAALQASRATLEAAARKHGGLVSRMAAIQAEIARIDFNLMLAYASDIARYYQPLRRPSPRHSRSAISWGSSGRCPPSSRSSSP